MSYAGTLTMPSNYFVMADDEMMYLEGGLNARQLYVSDKLLDKSYCMSIATNYVAATGLSKTRIAKEIYAHAVLYFTGIGGYASSTVIGSMSNIALGSVIKAACSYIIDHSNPIDLGGDSWIRERIFDIIWKI